MRFLLIFALFFLLGGGSFASAAVTATPLLYADPETAAPAPTSQAGRYVLRSEAAENSLLAYTKQTPCGNGYIKAGCTGYRTPGTYTII